MSEPVSPSSVSRALAHGARVAIITAEGTFTYPDLLDASARVAGWLAPSEADLQEQRVGLLAPPSLAYVASQWGIWRAGGMVVPMATSHPPPEWAHLLDDAAPAVVLAHPDLAPKLAPLAQARGIRVGTTSEALGHEQPPSLPRIAEHRRAMMVYTSGTTGRPKGVVTTHAQLRAQVTSLVTAWEWTAQDRILLVLPLHHVHGIVNVLTCALWAGACCEMTPRFDADDAWARLRHHRPTLFMAVPTIYRRLIDAWEAASEEERHAMSEGCRQCRLMVSGSAALPVSTCERWTEISGHVLLERYGMTELGMVLANPLHGERVPGHVGNPLPGVEVRLVDEEERPVAEGSPGEIQVRGPTVFLEYWARPEETERAFRGGWFATGDIAVVERGSYRILGRSSVDIIKTGGYKVSALEIEEVLRTHPDVAECAVVGVKDEDWGERVCAAIEVRGGKGVSEGSLRDWAAQRLAPYKVPRTVVRVGMLPRNAMGKVTKPEVAALFARAGGDRDGMSQST